MNKLNKDTSEAASIPDGSAQADLEKMDHAQDLRLVGLAQEGDTTAYDQLIIRHRERIYAMIRNMVKNDADAWDLSQEVFIRAWHALPRFEARSRFSTWLFRISHNAVYDWIRKRKHDNAGEFHDEIFERESISLSAKTAPSFSEAPDEALSNHELRIKIEQSLAKLSPEHREVVLLKDVQGLSYKEIADIMSCTLGTVMSRLFYARQKLQTLLKNDYESR